MSDTKLEWDGEKIKQVTASKEHKFSPKDIINSLAGLRFQMDQTKTSRQQAKVTIKNADINLKSMKETENGLKPFEKKCMELQLDKLKLYLKQLHKECYDKAAKLSKEVVAMDPNAYNPDSEKRIGYLDYQKNLATHPKIAENISAVLIKKYLFEKPVFDNPFKD